MFVNTCKIKEWDEMERGGNQVTKLTMHQMNLFGLTSSKSTKYLGGFGHETYQHPSSIDVEEIYDSK